MRSMCETQNSTLDGTEEKVDAEVDLDNKEVMNQIGFESPEMQVNLEELGKTLTLSGGTIIIKTDNYSLRVNKNSVSTDIKIFFGAAGMEIVGPEASFAQKTALVQSFLSALKAMGNQAYIAEISEEEAEIAYT